MEYHDDGIFPLLRHLAPHSNSNDDIEQSPAQGGIAVEDDLEQLNRDSVRSDSLSVRQRADGTSQLLCIGGYASCRPNHTSLSPVVQWFGQ